MSKITIYLQCQTHENVASHFLKITLVIWFVEWLGMMIECCGLVVGTRGWRYLHEDIFLLHKLRILLKRELTTHECKMCLWVMTPPKNYKMKIWLYTVTRKPNYCDDKIKSHIIFNSLTHLSHFQTTRLTSSNRTCDKINTPCVNVTEHDLM